MYIHTSLLLAIHLPSVFIPILYLIIISIYWSLDTTTIWIIDNHEEKEILWCIQSTYCRNALRTWSGWRSPWLRKCFYSVKPTLKRRREAKSEQGIIEFHLTQLARHRTGNTSFSLQHFSFSEHDKDILKKSYYYLGSKTHTKQNRMILG